MNSDVELTPGARRIYESSAYAQLRARRGRLSLILSLAMLAIYYGFITLIAFSPKTLAMKLGAGVMTLGLPLGAGVILSAVILTGIYVWRANREFDALTVEALKSAQ